MASTSSLAIIPTANYDIFLSFRGEDTRHNFTDHLYETLTNAGIRTFRDNEDISRGDDLKPEIESAIKGSKGSIIVLSKNYATSTWCLDELWLILEQRSKFDHFVLPIFYDVDPSDVRNQDQTFKIEVKTSSKWTDDNVKRWREALTKVADLKGGILSGSEVDFLKKIVDDIYYKVARKIVNLPRNLIGMNARDEEINSWLEKTDIQVLAICGMGGSGKTTLADYIVSSNLQHFEITSVVKLGASGTCHKQDNMFELFEKFSEDLLRGRKGKVMRRYMIYRVLEMKKTLIVFDDIDDPSQLDLFLGTTKINERSKIIITTRKTNTHNWFSFRSWSCQEYTMPLLDNDESLKLLSLHAFELETPMRGYEELAKEVLEYCGGNPLALEVMGSSLKEVINIEFWRSTLDVLKGNMSFGIQCVLKRSYDSLPNKNNKELFLHIACFFVGEDKDYVEKILEHDYYALSGIKVLTNRCLLSVSPNNKVMMHQLIQEMGRSIVLQESNIPAKRSRVWLSSDSYKIMRKGEGSETMEGLVLDMQLLWNDRHESESSNLRTDSLTKMDNLKLLRLNEAHLIGSYRDVSQDLRWLCWRGFHLTTIPFGLFQGNLVAIDMRHSNLEVFEPPIVLQSLKTLNLQGSQSLSEIRNIYRLPSLETLILCHCYELVHFCESIGDLKNLSLLNMIGCKSLPRVVVSNRSLEASTSSGGNSQQTSFSLPHSLIWLSLRSCNLECTEYFPLSFKVQPKLQYLDLGGGWFESLPEYNHLENLRVLDLTSCRKLKWILCLPSALAELYVYFCYSLERITFESHQFTLQEFGYQGCIKLSEIEGFIKLVPIAKLDATDLGHMEWLKEYQNHVVSLVGDEELITIGRSKRIQMLYELGIMSTSLPDIRDPNITLEYISESQSLSFEVPPCPENKRLIGLNVGFRYTISGKEWTWFAKINTTNDVDYMYNPHLFGDPGAGNVGIWLSFWPIGSKLSIKDKVNVSIIVMSGVLEVQECGASLVYVDDDETLENNTQWDLSAFQLTTGAFYLCRRDLFMLMEVGRLTPGWLSILVGDNIDDTEVRGWRKTGRPYLLDPSLMEFSDPSLTELSYPSRRELQPSCRRVFQGLLSTKLSELSFTKSKQD
ncbi:hypothetical protein OSB04_015348 [Centaurea solstitialis]|uniref:TIR domain-containing protein n=1 Tax=Centaurea solstitialis TaxID=347529 RepID=A0AA38TIU3_9ASTR|nr:hypothetical protein OSB04_015348 [Centaurea solstitialis]